jgi:hypothetical protein
MVLISFQVGTGPMSSTHLCLADVVGSHRPIITRYARRPAGVFANVDRKSLAGIRRESGQF